MATLGSALLAGCSGTDDSQRPTEQTSLRTTTRDRQTTLETATPTDVETTSQEEQLLAETHAADELDGVVGRLEYGSTTLDLQPADANADYAASTVFDTYNGELTVALNLNQAFRHRHTSLPDAWGVEEGTEGYQVRQFIENISQRNMAWISLVNNDFAEADGNEHLPELRDEIDLDTYTNEELDFETRMAESGIYDLWTKHEIINLPGGGGSELDQFMAAALQGTELNAGFNTFIWDYNIPGHGLAGAIENPTRNPDETNRQETYVLETDDRATAEQRIQTWEDSPYRTGDGIAPHDAHESNTGANMYSETAFYNFERGELVSIQNGQEIGERFDQFYREPESTPAYHLLDPLMAAEYINDMNEASVSLAESTLGISN
ncbi:hypothetical protein [Haloarchaeobius baliensis]|uniref:hypothetical protein n=1 Tax=Haloarchaeobius baliensis TaxID=1670458 RepID=UPI003F881206